MTLRSTVIAALTLAALGACTSETTSRGLSDPAPLATAGPVAQSAQTAKPAAPQAQTGFAIRAVEVEVPRSLRVSEANMLVPLADIVWREDPRGDRYAQVDALMTAAARNATQDMRRGTPAVLTLTMRRFHALTERARYTTGGNFAIQFEMRLSDPKTGALLAPPRPVVLDIPASGGQRALDEEARGVTQRVVITAGVVKGLRDQLAILARGAAGQPVAALR
ncbi:MAG: hypothetical protein IE922_08225 [Sphingomonadales bacterium]|nr:hypothetical protein [Sphingomonadales bacterium]